MVQSMKHKRVVFFSFQIIDVKIKTGHFSYNEIPPVCKLTAPFPSSSSLKVVLSIKRVTHPSQKNLLCLLDYIFCAYQNLMIANFCILTTETRDVMGPQGIVSSSKLLKEIPGQGLCHHCHLHTVGYIILIKCANWDKIITKSGKIAISYTNMAIFLVKRATK